MKCIEPVSPKQNKIKCKTSNVMNCAQITNEKSPSIIKNKDGNSSKHGETKKEKHLHFDIENCCYENNLFLSLKGLSSKQYSANMISSWHCSSDKDNQDNQVLQPAIRTYDEDSLLNEENDDLQDAPKWIITTNSGGIIVKQALLILIFVYYARYDAKIDPNLIKNNVHPGLGGNDWLKPEVSILCQNFQSMVATLLIGFGLQSSMLYDYTYSGLAGNFLMFFLSFQWAFICQELITLSSFSSFIDIDVERLIKVIPATMTVSIVQGCLAGSVSINQMIFINTVMVPCALFAEYTNQTLLQVADRGRTMSCHIFSGIFGIVSFLVFSKLCYKPELKEHSTKHGELTSLLGTLVIITQWPGMLMTAMYGDSKQRTVINVILALSSACSTSFITSLACNKSRKFTMEHIRCGVLSTCVTIASVAEFSLDVFGALLIGIASSFISVLALSKLPIITYNKRVQWLFCTHVLPGVMGAVMTAIIAAMAPPVLHQSVQIRLFEIYPARVPVAGSLYYSDVVNYLLVAPGKGRNNWEQAGYQLIALVSSVVIAAVTGAVTGLLLKLPSMRSSKNGLSPRDVEKTDSYYWNLPLKSGQPHYSNSFMSSHNE